MNKRTVKTIILMLLVSLFICPGRMPAQPEVSSEAALLMDMENGQVLYQKNAGKMMYPASTTKILTALVVIKNSSLEDRVKVSHEAASVGGSHVGLQEGEVLRLEDLLYILLLSSANDAAIALAEHTGGSVGHFAQLMNEQARAMGAVHSNFTNPHGLHDPDHYTTAGDLAIITREAMKNPVFRKIVGTYHFKTERTLPQAVEGIPQVDFVNHNKLLRPGYSLGFEGVTGVKTGYTDESGQCLVAAARRDGRELLTVVLKSENSGVYTDTAALLNHGFTDFSPVVLTGAGTEEGTAPVKGGMEKSVSAVTSRQCYYNLPAGGDGNIQKETSIDPTLSAPVKKGQKIGALRFLRQGEVVGAVDLVSGRDVDKKPLFHWWYGLIVLGPLFLLGWKRDRSRRRRYLMRKKRWN